MRGYENAMMLPVSVVGIIVPPAEGENYAAVLLMVVA